MKSLAVTYIELEQRQKELEVQRVTAEDQAKQEKLLKELQGRLIQFGFSSFNVDEIALAEDKLRPSMEIREQGDTFQREISLNLSASDGVRLKWAYYLSPFVTDAIFSSAASANGIMG